MEKLILLTLALGQVALPLQVARDPNPRRGLKRALALLAVFTVVAGGLFVLIIPYLD
jgi:hypothetical protein